jgi:hypothetical protein
MADPKNYTIKVVDHMKQPNSGDAPTVGDVAERNRSMSYGQRGKSSRSTGIMGMYKRARRQAKGNK